MTCRSAAALVALACGCSAVADDVESEALAPAELRAGIERTLPLLQRSMDTWIQKETCVSCHHQGLGTMAVTMARERSSTVDEELHERQVARLLDVTPGGTLHGDAGINGTFGRSFQLLGLAAAGTLRDERTEAVAYYLSGNAVRRGETAMWLSESFRPPLEASAATGTAIAIRTIELYHADGRAADAAETIARGRRWLEELAPRDAEERAMRLFGLRWSGATEEQVRAAADLILQEQREDGGWAQIATLESDAYATGQALVALQQMGGLSTQEPAFRRGVRFLLDRQLDDGSWLVETRRRSPGLPYFETGFPHRAHQFISTAATAWATMALCCALDPQPSAVFHRPRLARSAAAGQLGLEAVHLAAAFGTLDELRRVLDAGADPNARGPEDLTPLHLAVRDADRVELLLARGAEVDARTARGATPLVLAAWYDGGDRAAQLLLAHGADLSARAHEDGLTPFLRAVRSGKLDLVRRLHAAGAALEPVDAEETSALHLAASSGDVEMVELLLALGATVDVRCEGSTPLHWASHDGKDELVRLLLAHGADPNATDGEGLTPLAWAAKVEHGNARTLVALLGAGSDPSVRCASDKTPLDWARYFENELAVAALEAAGLRR